MKNIICNLLILGALFISTQYKGQHLLEALDAPFNTLIGTPPIGGDDSIEKEKCIQQGFSWSEGIHPLSSPRGCYCPLNNIYTGGPATWNIKQGIWECVPNIIDPPNRDPGGCVDDEGCDRVKPPQ